MELAETRRNWQWYALLILSVIFFAMGLEGLFRYAAWHNLAFSIWDNLYQALQLISLNSGVLEPPIPIELNLARFLLPMLAGAAAIKAFWEVFRLQISAIRLGGLRGHVLICGLSRKGFLLAMEFHRQGYPVVVIEEDDENDWLESCREQGMYVLVGDATDPAMLSQARIGHALGLFAVCDEDGINAELVVRAQELAPARSGRPITVVAHISDPQLCGLLRDKEAALQRGAMRLELFNIYERGAQAILRQYPAWLPGQPDRLGHDPHILLIGMGRMGENLAVYTARDWFASRTAPDRRLTITVIDRQAERKTASLRVRYPRLAGACELIPLNMELRTAEFESGFFLYGADGRLLFDIIYLCLDSDALVLQAGLRLLSCLHGEDVPIVLRMAESTGLARLLDGARDTRGVYQNLAPFCLLEPASLAGLLTRSLRDVLARAAYEEGLRQPGDVPGSSPVGTFPKPSGLAPWDQVNAAAQAASYQLVDRLTGAINAVGYTIVPLVDWEALSYRFPALDAERMAAYTHAHQPGDPPSNHPDWEELPEMVCEDYLRLVRGIPAFLGRTGYQVRAIL